MADDKPSKLITDSKELVALELYKDIRNWIYTDKKRDQQFYLDLYKECLRTVRNPNK